jgi:hypothetical protein
MITAVQGLIKDILQEFKLRQNYANPFNPATTIFFRIPSKALVSIKVFDLTGRDGTTIVSEELSAGACLRQWNAAGFVRGVYLYHLQVGKYIKSKKLVLLRSWCK